MAVILGNAIGGEKHYESNTRIQLPEMLRDLQSAPTFAALPAQARAAIVDEASKEFLSRYFEITEDTMPGELANVLAGPTPPARPAWQRSGPLPRGWCRTSSTSR